MRLASPFPSPEPPPQGASGTKRILSIDVMTIETGTPVAQRMLGQTGLSVSEVSLGTVALGMNYGIQASGDYGKPTFAEVRRILETAVDSGINLFDTAPGYGDSESLLGQVLGNRNECLFATKVPIPQDPDGQKLYGGRLKEGVTRLLEQSAKRLHREVLDIVQINNPTVQVLKDGELSEILIQAQHKGLVRVLGASVYEEKEALEVLHSGIFGVIQVAYNILDQRMANRVFSTAQEMGVGIMVRSAFLKGVLTSKAQWLPAELMTLRHAAERVKTSLAGSWESLPNMALKFCLSSRHVGTILIGVRTLDELRQSVALVGTGSLNSHLVKVAESLALGDDPLLNPRHWPVQ